MLNIASGMKVSLSAPLSFRSMLIGLLNSAVLLAGACHASPFLPVIHEATLARTDARPGDEFGLVLKLSNRGSEPSLLPAQVDVEIRSKGGTDSKSVGSGEPYPLTTMWTGDRSVTLGVPILLPADLKPAEYDVYVVFRTKFGRRVIPSVLGNTEASQESALIGHLSVVSEGSPAARPKTEKFGDIQTSVASKSDKPTKSILLTNGALSVRLAEQSPNIVEVGKSGGQTLTGPQAQRIPEFRFYRKSDDKWFSSLSSSNSSVIYTTKKEGDRVIYHAEIKVGSEIAFSCDLVFSIANQELRVGYENVRENDNYLFMEVGWPRLLEASTPETRLANGRFAGRLLNPATCTPGVITHEDTWYDPFSGALLYTPDILAAVLPVSPGDTISSSIASNGKPSAGVGAQLIHRIGSLDGKWDRWILAGGSSMLRVRFIERSDSMAAPLTWMDGARLLRRDLSDIRPPDYYKNSVLYKILMDIKKYPGIPDDKAVTTCQEAQEIIRQVGILSDNQKQIVYLTGAQHEGQDIKYPDMFTVNTQVGTYDELIDFMNSGREQNAVISFHSVLNEIYQDSPMWDENLVCRDPAGNLAVYTTHFVGGTNYSINYPYFVSHALQGFLDRLLSMYPIPSTYHIDVLSTRAHNIDFDPQHQCAPIDGYFGRLNMIQSFNIRGVDITSEGLTSWFIGKIGHAWLLRMDPFTSILGEEQIPLAAFIYHGHATYGYPSELNPLIGLLNGATFSLDLVPLDRMSYHWKGNTIEDALYLVNAPYQMLRDREMQGYERDGDTQRVSYDEDTFVEITVPGSLTRAYQGYQKDASGSFRVVLDGREVAKDFTAFVPGRMAGTYLAYSKFGGTVTYTTPAGWSEGKALVCQPLEKNPAKSAPKAEATLSNGSITLVLPAGVPVRISQP